MGQRIQPRLGDTDYWKKPRVGRSTRKRYGITTEKTIPFRGKGRALRNSIVKGAKIDLKVVIVHL